jgi:hypothetical protein
MMIVVFVESWNNQFKKASFEAVSYARSWANTAGCGVRAITSASARTRANWPNTVPMKSQP